MSGVDIQAYYDRRADQCREHLRQLDARASAKAKGESKQVPRESKPQMATKILEFASITTISANT